MDRLGIPYMGSKRAISKHITDFIIFENPNVRYVYDLFGGGGAISLEFLKKPQIQKVFYNELNTGISELMLHIQKNGVTKDMYEFVDRETFMNHKNDDNWYGGFVKSCYSFGNNQKDYIFSKVREKEKELAHNVVVHCRENDILEIEKMLDIKIDREIFKIDDLHKRRIAFCHFARGSNMRYWQEGLINISALEQVSKSLRYDLENLERIENLQNLQNLQVSNLSYDEVQIETPPEETVLYLDPPYEGTAQYQKSIDYDKLKDFIRNSKYKIYFSEYKSEFREVASFNKRCTLSGRANNLSIEKLFTNQ